MLPTRSSVLLVLFVSLLTLASSLEPNPAPTDIFKHLRASQHHVSLANPGLKGPASSVDTGPAAPKGGLSDQNEQMLWIGLIVGCVALITFLIVTFREALKPCVAATENAIASFVSVLMMPLRLVMQLLLSIIYPVKQCCFGTFERTDDYLHPWKITT